MYSFKARKIEKFEKVERIEEKKLMRFNNIKLKNNGILTCEKLPLKVGYNVYLYNKEKGVNELPLDREYILDDGTTILVESGKVKSIARANELKSIKDDLKSLLKKSK